jgi:hypothetical protein
VCWFFLIKGQRPNVKLKTSSTATRYKMLNPAYKKELYPHTKTCLRKTTAGSTKQPAQLLQRLRGSRARARQALVLGRSSSKEVIHRTLHPLGHSIVVGTATRSRPAPGIGQCCLQTSADLTRAQQETPRVQNNQKSLAKASRTKNQRQKHRNSAIPPLESCPPWTPRRCL